MKHTIKKAKSLSGSIQVPGDKSISHRGLLMGAIAEGETKIHNLSSSVDVMHTLECLKKLNVKITRDGESSTVSGKGLYGLSESPEPLDCGNSGTTMRLISGILAAQPFSTTLIGDASLSNRPMKRIIEPLSQMGVTIDSQPGGLAPLTIHGGNLNPISYHSPVASAQVKSCVLLAGLYAYGVTTVVEPLPSRDHTERMLADFGVIVEQKDLAVSVAGSQKLHGREVRMPGDFSSAAFFIGAALIVPGSKLIIKNICLNPTRTGLLDVLNQMGANIEIFRYDVPSSEPIGEITVYSSALKGIDIAPGVLPGMIDEVPILAVIATQAAGITKLTGARELRVKESDRLRAIVQNLKLMGIKIEELEDGFIIEGPQQLKGASIDSYGDHRIAMAFAIAGLIAEGETQSINADCVAVSMPDFFETLQGVVRA